MTDKKLSDKELSKINELDTENELSCAKITIKDLELKNLVLQQKIIGHEISLKSHEREALRSAHAQKMEERRSFLLIMKKKHDLKDGWGFDPISGDIKEDDQ